MIYNAGIRNFTNDSVLPNSPCTFCFWHFNFHIVTQNLKITLSIIIRWGSNPGHTICSPAATCGKSYRARIGTWEQVGQFLCGWIKSISFQKHVHHGFKTICYRISNIFIALVVYSYELIVCMLLERNAFESIAFFSQCTIMASYIFHHYCSCYKSPLIGVSIIVLKII